MLSEQVSFDNDVTTVAFRVKPSWPYLTVSLLCYLLKSFIHGSE